MTIIVNIGNTCTLKRGEMFDFLKKWFHADDERPAVKPPQARYRASVVKPKPIARPAASEQSERLDPTVAGRIEDGGPGKNILMRTRYQREDTGTHETLRIIDEDSLRNPDEDGIDPYNTGKFDRSKHWDKRFRN